MWPKNYRDYPEDAPLVQNQVEPGKGIVGCEMHEMNGWGAAHEVPVRNRKRGIITALLEELLTWR